MQAFLDDEENRNDTNEDSAINYFDAIPDEDDNNEINYNKFYGDEGQEDEGYEQDESDEEGSEENVLSTFEVREKRLKTQMKQFEEDIVATKPWQLKGEADSKNRPVNSLLEEVLEFDSTSRAPLIITEGTSEKLEDIILNRIKNNLFDDVVRKVNNKDKQIPTKQIILNQEKSKDSLATIYEKEFNKNINSNNEEADPTKQEISNMMYSLFTKLDSLSNFHVAPQRLQEEPRIITNTLSLQMEEVAPVSVSTINTLAPEEIKSRKNNVLGNSEKTKSAKRKHRKLKAIKYNDKKIVDKKSDKVRRFHIVYSYYSFLIFFSFQVSKSESNSALKTSTAFFSELQSTTSNLKHKKSMPHIQPSKKFKL